jgi:hypothetical protein
MARTLRRRALEPRVMILNRIRAAADAPVSQREPTAPREQHGERVRRASSSSRAHSASAGSGRPSGSSKVLVSALRADPRETGRRAASTPRPRPLECRRRARSSATPTSTTCESWVRTSSSARPRRSNRFFVNPRDDPIAIRCHGGYVSGRVDRTSRQDTGGRPDGVRGSDGSSAATSTWAPSRGCCSERC